MAEGTGSEEKLWQSFFDQHQSLVSLLDTHASLLAEMRKHCADSAAVKLVETRLVTTENLIATFRESTESLREVSKQQEAVPKKADNFNPTMPYPVPAPQPHIPTEPIVDPSGLFTVDTNPTPLDQLFQNKSNPTSANKAKKQGKKRKASDSGHGPTAGDGGSENTPESKKLRSSAGQEHQEAAGEDDSFVRGVEERARAKEERRKARADKKRKRQSDGSTNSSSKGPKNKKQKQRHMEKLAANGDGPAPGGKRANETQNSHPSKKRKKTKR
ncbi:hypothetical protein ABEF95_015286 [Exophiala dermatitidis]|uniref:Uncharacterized protein n=1 Tax=Exophiala dermatitidis (strain ATCC 34100 / CBS 525.76 / NIH/UT8656) TaxID=858893 RepID=H6C6G3_EXODN|nr:uncharacterized protein HMPREF1120_07301 [Exophiala dermatitidis NIH/UT8656]EHY59309.1 hypothetical protein HMPREF1120_07301 [Exophiala dermatitidis NIH/UT8656]